MSGDGDPQLRMEISALTEAVRMLTYENMGIGHQVGRIADHFTGRPTGFEPQDVVPATTAQDSVQSSSEPAPVDPEEPSLPPPTAVMVDVMLRQVGIDRVAGYWTQRQDQLDSVESYLLSLKDHLS